MKDGETKKEDLLQQTSGEGGGAALRAGSATWGAAFLRRASEVNVSQPSSLDSLVFLTFLRRSIPQKILLRPETCGAVGALSGGKIRPFGEEEESGLGPVAGQWEAPVSQASLTWVIGEAG